MVFMFFFFVSFLAINLINIFLFNVGHIDPL